MSRTALGFTVIELMAVVVVTAVLLTLAVPAFLDLLARRRLEGVANELSADLHYARSEAVSRQRTVTVATQAGGYCITATPPCAPATAIKTVTLPGEVTLTDGVTLAYDALRGQTSGATPSITVSSTRSPARLRLDDLFAGGMRLCSPDGSLKGYPACPAS